MNRPAVPPQVPDTAELAREGWTRRSVVGADLVAELVALYRAIGFEVLTLAVPLGALGSPCDTCLVAAPAGSVAIYTRPSRGRCADGADAERKGA